MTTKKEMVEERIKTVVSELAEEQATRVSEGKAANAAKVAVEEAYERTKDSHTNFAYIMTFIEAIRAQQCADSPGGRKIEEHRSCH